MKIVCMRYGINENKTHTLREIGEAFDISADRVRQIEIRALLKLYYIEKGIDVFVVGRPKALQSFTFSSIQKNKFLLDKIITEVKDGIRQ